MRLPTPIELKRFFTSKTGWLALGLLALTILVLTMGNVRERSDQRRDARTDLGSEQVLGTNDQRPVGTIQRETAGQLPDEAPEPTPEEKRTVVVAAPSPTPTPRPLPPERMRLAAGPVGLPAKATKPTPTPAPAPKIAGRNGRRFSDRFAPYGRMIPCQLVNTVDSSRIETPVIGLVTEDVWSWGDGQLLIPAGSEVHGVAQTDREKGRIRAEGSWVVVLPEFSDVLNGTELVVNGAAMASQNETVQHGGAETWGIDDGSFGMLGKTIRSDNYGDLKLFAAAFLASAAQTLQTRDGQTAGPFGGTFQGQIQSTPQNAGLAGVSAVVDEYVQQLREEIAQNGFYTRVVGGTQFYLYVRQTLDLEDARVGESEAERENWERRRAAEQDRLNGVERASPSAPLISPADLEVFKQMAQPQQFVPQPDPMPSQLREQQQQQNSQLQPGQPQQQQPQTATP